MFALWVSVLATVPIAPQYRSTSPLYAFLEAHRLTLRFLLAATSTTFDIPLSSYLRASGSISFYTRLTFASLVWKILATRSTRIGGSLESDFTSEGSSQR